MSRFLQLFWFIVVLQEGKIISMNTASNNKVAREIISYK